MAATHQTEHTMQPAYNLELLDFIVINTQTGQPVAAFMLPTDAQRFAELKGEHYEVMNADGTSLVGAR